jgi:class 3 adenylate cyclase
MIRQSIKRQIVSIAVGLIVLMIITSVLSMVMAGRIAHQLDELTTKYFQAYGHLARMNIRSLERALALRRMVIAKMQEPPDEVGYADRLRTFEAKGREVEQEAEAARKLIIAIIEDVTTDSDNAALARVETRIDDTNKDLRRHLNDENAQLFPLINARDFAGIRRSLARIDTLRDETNEKIETIRGEMMAQVRLDAMTTMRDQQRAILISAIVTALAAILGLVFAVLVSSGITRPVQRWLEGTRAVEAGRLDGSIGITTRDEIGQLSAAFNRMVERLRHNERIRETFGRYIDPKVVEGLIDRPALAATEGQRRVMTVIIDKYIGDAIMAYWGPPFIEEADQACFACLAAIDMIGRIPTLRKELPELLGVRSIPMECDIRIGIATGEVLVGSIGSEFMMSYTVMGDTVNLAARLETANKLYSSRSLVSETTFVAARAEIEAREIDRIVVVGQTSPQVVFEIMGLKGDLNTEQLLLQTRYTEGLAAYRTRRWDEARSAFNAALEAVPGDGPSITLVKRVDSLQANPPAENWDGSWRLDQK